MTNGEIGAFLARLRETAGITQSQLAGRLSISQTKVSRMETGDAQFALEDYGGYLEALDTAEARRARRLLDVAWTHLPKPALRHPDIDSLVAAEGALGRLSAFLANDKAPKALAGQAEMLFRRVHDFGDFLHSLQHRLAYVGDIGVGKTTAACRLAGLVLVPEAQSGLRDGLLDTGGGRVTLCEVSVVRGAGFAIDVAPLSDEEVYRLLHDFCRSVEAAARAAASAAQGGGDASARGDAAGGAADYRVPEETERALRNMCGLPRPPRRKGEPPSDPAIDLLKSKGGNLDDLKAELAGRLALWRRNRRSAVFQGADELAGRAWIKESFAAINAGRHAEFSLPDRIRITVPFAVFPTSAFEVEMVDTRGVDGSAIRPDIAAKMRDRRTISILCSRFNSAPDVALQQLLEHALETEADAGGVKGRTILLVLARQGEPLEMRDDSGAAAQDVEDGYDLKRVHVEDALLKLGAGGVAVDFFDAANDPAGQVSAMFERKILEVRKAHAEGLQGAIAAVDEMLNNVAKAQALAVLEAANRELTVFAGRHKQLKRTQATVYGRLIRAVRERHARTVWAAARRKGDFWNFNMYQYLGDGGAAEAKRRSAEPIAGLREIIQQKLADPEFTSARRFLEQVLEDVAVWEGEFVEAVRHYAVTIYGDELAAAATMWTACEEPYGSGMPDYRGEVADTLERWFQAQDELAERMERRIQRAWRTAIVEPLRKAASEA